MHRLRLRLMRRSSEVRELFDRDGDEIPATVLRVGDLAASCGWEAAFTWAGGPPPSIALRARRGRRCLFGLWLLDKGVRWRGGAASDMRHLRTLAQLKAELMSDA